MKPNSPSRSPSLGYTILVAINLLLSLMAAEMLDYAASIHDATLIWLSAVLLLILLALLAGSLWRARKLGIVSPSARLSWHVPQRIIWPTLLAITALAAGLRFYQLGAESFWSDEMWTSSVAGWPLSEIYAVVNPWSYIPLHFFLQLDRSEFFLRFSSVLPGVLTVPVVYHLGRTLYRRGEGLIAAFLLSISVYAIYHSQELRFYAWQMLFSSLTLYFLLRALDQSRIQHWVGFAASTVLNLYNHPLALFVVASECLYIAFILTRDLVLCPELRAAPWSAKLRSWLRSAAWPGIAVAVALAAYLPAVPQLAGFYNPKWVADLQPNQVQPLISFDPVWLYDPIVVWIHGVFGDFTGTSSQPIFLYPVLGLLILGLIRSPRRIVVLTLAFVLLPFAVMLLTKTRMYGRYFSYLLPLFLVIISRSIVYLAETLGLQPKRRNILILLLTVLVATPNLIRLPAYYAEPEKTQWRELAAVVDTLHQPDDLLLISYFYPLGRIPLEWYTTTSDSELPRRLFPEAGVLGAVDQLDELPSYTQGHRRVWFVVSSRAPEIEAMLVTAMHRNYRQVNKWIFVDLHLLLFEVE